MPTQKFELIQGGKGEKKIAETPKILKNELQKVIAGIQQRFGRFIKDVELNLQKTGMEIQQASFTFLIRHDDPKELIDVIQRWINEILEESGRNDELFIQVKTKPRKVSEYRGLYERLERMKKIKGDLGFREFVRQGESQKMLTTEDIKKIITPNGVKERTRKILKNILHDLFREENKISVRDFFRKKFPQIDITEKEQE